MSKFLQNTLVEFIYTKYKSTIIDETKVLFKQSNPMQKLFSDDSLLPVIQQSIQHNCYFAHPKNVLLIMLGDDNKAIRAKAVNMIFKVSANNQIEAHNHNSLGSFIFPDAISMQISYYVIV